MAGAVLATTSRNSAALRREWQLSKTVWGLTQDSNGEAIRPGRWSEEWRGGCDGLGRRAHGGDGVRLGCARRTKRARARKWGNEEQQQRGARMSSPARASGGEAGACRPRGGLHLCAVGHGDVIRKRRFWFRHGEDDWQCDFAWSQLLIRALFAKNLVNKVVELYVISFFVNMNMLWFGLD